MDSIVVLALADDTPGAELMAANLRGRGHGAFVALEAQQTPDGAVVVPAPIPPELELELRGAKPFMAPETILLIGAWAQEFNEGDELAAVTAGQRVVRCYAAPSNPIDAGVMLDRLLADN